MAQEAKPTEPRRRLPSKQWIAVIVAGLLTVLAAIRITYFVTAKPTITNNYATAYNELTRPDPYDPNDNAAPLYAEALARLREWPSDPEAMDMVLKAAEKPYCWFEHTSLDPNEMGRPLASFRLTAQGLSYQVVQQRTDGDVDQALHTLTMLARIPHHLFGSCVVSMQTNTAAALSGLLQHEAWALLAKHDLESDQLKMLQQEVETLLAQRPPLTLAGERLRLLDMVQQYFTDDGKGDGHLVVAKAYDESIRLNQPPNDLADAATYVRHVVIAWRHPSRKKTVQTLENLMPTLEALGRQTPWQLHQNGTSYEEEIRKHITGYYFFELVRLPKRGTTFEIHHRVQASVDALVATIALLRYRQDKGHWPQNLQALVDEHYIRAVPLDPYSGSALTYRPAGATFLLYGLGADFDDDGGIPSNWGQGAKGGDQVFWPR